MSLRRSGGPNDWLKLKRKELPDRQTRLEHEYLWLEAEQLCDWFERSESGVSSSSSITR